MDETFRLLFWDFIKQNSGHYVLFMILIMCSYPVKSILLPRFYGKLFDVLKEGSVDINAAKKLTLYIILLWIISQCAVLGITYIQTYIVPKYYMFFRTFLFDNILHRYKKEFKTLDAGSIIIRANELPWACKSLMFRLLNEVIPLSFSIIMTIFYFSKIGFRLGLITFSAIVIIGLITYYKLGECNVLAMDTYREVKNVNDYLSDKISNMFHIYTSSNINKEITNNIKSEDKLRLSDIDSGLCTLTLRSYLTIVSILCYIFSFIQCFVDFQNGKYAVGVFVSNIYILNYYLDFLENISVEIPGICYQSGVIRDELDYIMELSKSDHNDGETEHTIKDGIVKVKDIHFAYKDGRKIFNGFSLELKPNIKTAIIGKSGSGKSTLMKLLMGFFNVDKGEIVIDNVNIKDYSLNYLRKSISYVNQTTSLFNNTILYNITYGTDATEEETKKLIDNLKLWEVFKYVDYNLHKTVGSNGSNMSGGQKQIILILRALLNKNSKMIVMDEPTSALDSKNTKLFLDILSRIKNKTIIVITHDDILIEFVDKVIYLQN